MSTTDTLEGVRALLAAAEAAYAAGTCRPIAGLYADENDDGCRCAVGAALADLPAYYTGDGPRPPYFDVLCGERFGIGLATVQRVEEGFDFGLLGADAPARPLPDAWMLAYHFGQRMRAEYGEAVPRVPADGGAA